VTKTGSYVAEVNASQAKQIHEYVLNHGFELATPPYMQFQAKKKGLSISVYTSGKIVVQGKEKQDFIEFFLEPEVLNTFSYSSESIVDTTPRSGSDEAGKGDFFGPLCVCCAYASSGSIKELEKLGIQDSKKIADKKIHELAPKIKKLTRYSLVILSPEKYNSLYEDIGNLNELLAWAHTAAIEAVYKDTECKQVIVDKFAHESLIERRLKRKSIEIDLTQIPRAEEDIVVAAASIIARDAFVSSINKLSKDWGLTIPKGASKAVIAAGKQIVSKWGYEALSKLGKIHFKTYQDITKGELF
jgi:ribonuclease HIII